MTVKITATNTYTVTITEYTYFSKRIIRVFRNVLHQTNTIRIQMIQPPAERVRNTGY